MKPYFVKYRTENRPERTITAIISDGLMTETGHRWLIAEDGRRFEIPMADTTFEFSKERSENMVEAYEAKQKAETETK